MLSHVGFDRSAQVSDESLFWNGDANVLVCGRPPSRLRRDVSLIVHASVPRSLEQYARVCEGLRNATGGMSAILYGAKDFDHWRAWRPVLPAGRELSAAEGEHLDAVLAQQRRSLLRMAKPVCRMQSLIHYFDESNAASAQRCGRCDVCLGLTSRLPQEQVDQVLNAVGIVMAGSARPFSASMLTSLLLGKLNQRINDTALYQKDGFGTWPLRHTVLLMSALVAGALQSSGQTLVRIWLDQLLMQGLLRVSRSDNQVHDARV